MKKNLLPLTCCVVSFANIVFAENKDLTMEDFNVTLAEIAETEPIEYQLQFRVYSDDYDMQHSGYLMMLSDDWGIYAHGGGYIGMAKVEQYGHLHSETSWVYPTSFSTTTQKNWIWQNSGDYQLHSLVSRTSGGGFAQPGSEGMFVTLNVNDKGTTLTLLLNNNTASIIKTGYIVDLADVTLMDGTPDGFNQGVTGISHASITYTPSKTVPEPTTATLSLLALAGLAARRRRK